MINSNSVSESKLERLSDRELDTLIAAQRALIITQIEEVRQINPARAAIMYRELLEAEIQYGSKDSLAS